MLRPISNRKIQEYAKHLNTPDIMWPQLLSFVVAILCYLNSLFGEFVFDDYEAIETNFDVRPETPLKTIFENDFWGYPISSNVSHKSYRPLTTLTFRWNYYYGGLEPAGYHAVNIILHGVVSALFVSLCAVVFKDMKSRTTLAALSGILFALHPSHTEAVANVVGRADVLSALFFILAFLSYANCFYDDSAHNKMSARFSKFWIAVSLVCCAASLLCKEQGITVMGVCAVYDILYVCKLNATDVFYVLKNPILIVRPWPKKARSLAERLLFITLSALLLLYLRITVLAGGLPTSFTESDNPTSFDDDTATRWRTYSFLWALNGWLLLCPRDLCYDWSMDSIERIKSVTDIRNVATLGMLCVGACLAYYEESAMVQNMVLGNNMNNDPFSYTRLCHWTRLMSRVSFASACNQTPAKQVNGSKSKKKLSSIDANENVTHLSNGDLSNHSCSSPKKSGKEELNRQRVVLFCLAMMVIPFLPASNVFFPVGFVVAERVLYLPSMGFTALVALGIVTLFGQNKQQQQQQVQQQLKHNQWQKQRSKAVEGERAGHRIDWTFGLNQLGTVLVYGLLTLFAIKTLSRNAEWKNTESLASSGLKVNPGNAKIHLTMGNVLARKGMLASKSFYQEALRLRPRYTAAWVNLGLVLLNTGKPKEAEEHYRMALSIKPDSADANTNLAHLLRVTDRLHEADQQYRRAYELRPGDPQVCFQHGTVLEQLGRKKAEELLRRGLMMQPDSLDTRLLLASLLLSKGQLSAAELEARALLTRDKHNEGAEFILAKVLERKGLLKEAKKLYRQVLKKNHSHTGARTSLDQLGRER